MDLYKPNMVRCGTIIVDKDDKYIDMLKILQDAGFYVVLVNNGTDKTYIVTEISEACKMNLEDDYM